MTVWRFSFFCRRERERFEIICDVRRCDAIIFGDFCLCCSSCFHCFVMRRNESRRNRQWCSRFALFKEERYSGKKKRRRFTCIQHPCHLATALSSFGRRTRTHLRGSESYFVFSYSMEQSGEMKNVCNVFDMGQKIIHARKTTTVPVWED